MKLATRLVAWQRLHGRHDLPWQNTTDPYRVWLSEIMLQQTQVSAVIPYYQRFLKHYPDVGSLAKAPSEDVMALWAGLGYYARARNLHACAKVVMQDWAGQFPSDAKGLTSLPGIGPSTAAAIASFCYAERIAILDGNVKRVMARYFAVEGDVTTKTVEQQLWQHATAELPTATQLRRDPDIMSAYTQGLMDLGATLCTRHQPDCMNCPIQSGCAAFKHGRTQELPWPKSRKAVPERAIGMLIACHQGNILLEKRPNSGIWGGLWSLPEISHPDDPESKDSIMAAFCASLGLQSKKTHALPSFQHIFTHFKLNISPVLLHARNDSPVVKLQRQMEWVSVKKLPGLGMPAPVRKMLDGLMMDGLLTK